MMLDINTKHLEVQPTTLYRARVVDNLDPDGRGRVRVRVNALHGLPQAPSYLLDDQLPWALPGGWIGSGHNMGPFLVPVVGTVLYVMFEGGDLNMPVYFGGVPSLKGQRPKSLNANNEDVLGGEVLTDSDDLPEEITDPASMGIVFKSLKGSMIMYSDKDSEESLKVVGPGGLSMEINSYDTVDKRRSKDDPMDEGIVRFKLPFKV